MADDEAAKTEAPSMDQSGGLLKFFLVPKGVDIVQRVLAVESVRAYAADANFVKKLRETSAAAKAATSPEAIAAVTKSLMQDPRLTQCAMLGAGVRLEVKEDDLKKAEREGDIAKRSPLRVDDLVAAEDAATPEEARAAAKTAYAAGDVPKALAYWTKGLRFRRDKGLPDHDGEAASLYANVAQGLLKLQHYARAEQAATRALAYVAHDRDKRRTRKRRARYRPDAATAAAAAAAARDTATSGGETKKGDKADVEKKGDDDAAAAQKDDEEEWPEALAAACERKALFRRALALEGQRKFAAGLRDALAAAADGQSEAEAAATRKLVKRLESLVESEKKQAVEKIKRRQEEREGFQKRAAGVALTASQHSSSAPGASVGYVEERDYSSLATRRLRETLADVDVDLGRGASVRVDAFDEGQSSVSATVNSKRGKRALYYDLDLTATWTAESGPDFDLSSSQEENAQQKSISGTVRLYNVSHETRYEPGADPNVAYMYQLGYRGLKPAWFDGTSATSEAPGWARQLIDGAHSLYEAMALKVDAVIADLQTQLNDTSSS